MVNVRWTWTVYSLGHSSSYVWGPWFIKRSFDRHLLVGVFSVPLAEFKLLALFWSSELIFPAICKSITCYLVMERKTKTNVSDISLRKMFSYEQIVYAVQFYGAPWAYLWLVQPLCQSFHPMIWHQAKFYSHWVWPFTQCWVESKKMYS